MEDKLEVRPLGSQLPREILTRELIGLRVEVVESTCPGYVGLDGIVVDESRNMLEVDQGSKRRKLPKASSKFRIHIPAGGATEVEGRFLVGRPEDRMKREVKPKWRV